MRAWCEPTEHDQVSEPSARAPGRVALTDHLTRPLQRKASGQPVESGRIQLPEGLRADDGAARHAIAEQGFSGSPGALPFLGAIQASFGTHDVSGVRAYRDENAARATDQLGARAFARADQVAFGAEPDLHTAAHEAAHVVQQRAGVHLTGGTSREGDGYEQHADAVADLVVRGASAQSLLDQVSAEKAVGAPQDRSTLQTKKAAGKGKDEDLGSQELTTLATLTLEDAAERAYRGISVLENFDGDEDREADLYGDIVSTVNRLVMEARDFMPDGGKAALHKNATRVAHNALVLQNLAPYQDDFGDQVVEELQDFLGSAWKPPRGVGKTGKRVDFDSKEGLKSVRLALRGARADIQAALQLHRKHGNDKGDIWGTGGADFLTRAIEVLESKDMAKKRKSLRDDVIKTKHVALELMDWAPRGEYSLALRKNMSAILVLVGEDELPEAGAREDEAPADKPGKPDPEGDAEHIRQLEDFRTEREKAADSFEEMIEKRAAAVGEIDKEMDASDPKPTDFWGELIKSLGIAALSAVTGGIGAAVAKGVLDRLARELEEDTKLREALEEGLINLVGNGLNGLLTSAVKSVDGSPSKGGGASPDAEDGGWPSKDTRAAFFFAQQDALSTQKAVAKGEFWDQSENLAVMAHYSPAAATTLMRVMAFFLKTNIAPAVREQRRHTTAKWATYLMQAQYGVIDQPNPDDERKNELYESGYRGTNLDATTEGDEKTRKHGSWELKEDNDYLEIAGETGLLDFVLEGDEDGGWTLSHAQLLGLNSKLRERIRVMDLKAAGIPIRIRGMVRFNGKRDPLVIARSETGDIVLRAFSPDVTSWLEAIGDGDQFKGAFAIVDGVVAKTIKQHDLKLEG